MQADEELKLSGKPESYKEFCNRVAPEHRATIGSRLYISLEDENKVVEDAYSYFKTRKHSPHPITRKNTDIYSNNLIVAEVSHSDTLSKKFLMQHMKDLKAAGFEILFCEHLFYNDQEMLENYFSSGVMHDTLARRLKYLDEGHGTTNFMGANRHATTALWGQYNFTMIVQVARQAGIRVVGLDIQASYLTFKSGEDRVLMMNYLADQIIKREIEIHKCKWLGFMAGTHSSTIIQNIPGLASLTGARTVLISDVLGLKTKLTVTINGSNTIRDPELEIDVVLSGDVFISGNGSQLITGFSLSEARKAKLEDIKNILEKTLCSDDSKQETKSFGSVTVLDLITRAMSKKNFSEKEYHEAIEQIPLFLTEKIESEGRSSKLEAYQKILDLIAPDLPVQSLAYLLTIQKNREAMLEKSAYVDSLYEGTQALKQENSLNQPLFTILTEHAQFAKPLANGWLALKGTNPDLFIFENMTLLAQKAEHAECLRRGLWVLNGNRRLTKETFKCLIDNAPNAFVISQNMIKQPQITKQGLLIDTEDKSGPEETKADSAPPIQVISHIFDMLFKRELCQSNRTGALTKKQYELELIVSKLKVSIDIFKSNGDPKQLLEKINEFIIQFKTIPAFHVADENFPTSYQAIKVFFIPELEKLQLLLTSAPSIFPATASNSITPTNILTAGMYGSHSSPTTTVTSTPMEAQPQTAASEKTDTALSTAMSATMHV